MKLVKFEGWTTWSGTPMQTASLGSVGTNLHTLALTFAGANITVSYDGVQKISVTDNNFDGVAPFTNGGISADITPTRRCSRWRWIKCECDHHRDQSSARGREQRQLQRQRRVNPDRERAGRARQ